MYVCFLLVPCLHMRFPFSQEDYLIKLKFMQQFWLQFWYWAHLCFIVRLVRKNCDILKEMLGHMEVRLLSHLCYHCLTVPAYGTPFWVPIGMSSIGRQLSIGEPAHALFRIGRIDFSRFLEQFLENAMTPASSP